MQFGNIDGNGLAEIRNFNVQNLSSAPTTGLKKGRFYFNTTDNTLYVYNGTAWVDALSQGDYTFQNGVELVSGTRNVQVKLGTSSNATVVADSTGLSVSVPEASTSAKGVIEIATDSEASTGTSEVLAVNPKQLATKVTANNAITAGTGTVINYDAKGLVTSSSEIGIKSGSTNYLEFDTTNHQIGAKVDTTVTESSTNLITSGAVHTAITNALIGGVIYQGTWDITSATDFSGITLPVKKGYLYYVTGTGPKTIGGIEWNAGDYLMINKDVAAGGTLTSSDVEKVDNTEAADIVRLNATQTLTNKTIDADDNTISDLTASNLKSGVLLTSIRASSSASDTSWVTEKGIATALESRVYTAQNAALTVSGGICTWTVTHNMNNSNVGIHLYEVSSGDEVMFDRTITSANVVTIKILAEANISANIYKVVILG